MEPPKYKIGDQFIVPQTATVNGCKLSGLFTFVILKVEVAPGERVSYKYTLATQFPQPYWEPKDIIWLFELSLDGMTQTEGYFR